MRGKVDKNKLSNVKCYNCEHWKRIEKNHGYCNLQERERGATGSCKEFMWSKERTKEEPDELWLFVTKDKYELPLAVCDSIQELSKVSGNTVGNIYSAIYHAKMDNNRTQYVRVKIADLD